MKKTYEKIPCLQGTHEIYCCGARVRISEEGVKVIAEPTVRTCPLHEAMYGSRQIDAHSVKKSVETKIAHFGFCCISRHFDADPIVAYGASEMMQVWLRKGLMNCAVVACEGAGTVITSNGELVQGIGARLTGIIRTSPIREVIERIESQGGIVLDKSKARIDQVEGVKRAFDLGFKHISVSVAGFQAKDISKIRDFETAAKVDVLIFSVCNTCIGSADVKHIDKADIVCARARALLRE
jgi:putative methanogenesis marker protein 8